MLEYAVSICTLPGVFLLYAPGCQQVFALLVLKGTVLIYLVAVSAKPVDTYLEFFLCCVCISKAMSVGTSNITTKSTLILNRTRRSTLCNVMVVDALGLLFRTIVL